MSTALATLKDRHAYLTNTLEQSRPRIAALIPMSTGLTPSRAIAVVLDAVTREPSLLRCEPTSIVRATLQATEVGLELGSPLGEAYLVPFRNWKKGNREEAQFIAGYKGLIKLVTLNERVELVESRLVREGDAFDYRLGTDAAIEHKPGKGTIRNRGNITHAYALVRYTSGRVQFDVMDRDELDRIRSAARATKDSSPWNAHTDEMFRKCPVRRLAKYLRLSPLAARAVELDLRGEAVLRGELDPDAEGTFEAGRARDLRDMLGAGDRPVGVIDVEGDTLDDEGGAR